LVDNVQDAPLVARLVLWLSAFTFAGFGLAFALFPHPMAALVDIELPSDTARVDFAATYGGLELGLALFLLLCTRRDADVRLGLLASGCSLAGFAAARLAGILLSGPVAPLMYIVLVAEIGGSALSFWAATRR
jgi:Domain of unknown function (DUF4345)